MNLINKLKSYKEKINSFDVLNKELAELISIELFDFIEQDKKLRDEFYKRAQYLNNLASQPNFIDIQDRLYNAIVKVLKLVEISEIENLQNEPNKRVYVDFKGYENIWWTLPELYKGLLKKENYYRLGDKTWFSEGDIVGTLTTTAVRNQYETAEGLFKLIAYNFIFDNPELSEKYKISIEAYNKVWYEFDEWIYKIPLKQHIEKFIKFLYFSRTVYPRKGHEIYYHAFHNDVQKNNLVEVKKFCNVVIADLMEVMSQQAEIKINYTSKAEREAWTIKWETLQKIWTVYVSKNKLDTLLIPIERLTIKNRAAFEIDGILDGFKNEGCFDWKKEIENYEIKNVDHNQFVETYRKTGLIYNKFAKIYQERVSNKIFDHNQQTNKQEPILLKIVGMPELQVKGLSELVKNKVSEDKPKFPYKLPAGTKWEEITIKFEDDENVYIQVKQFKHTASYKELGLVGRGKNPNPSELWAFLKVLAQVNGELAIKDTQARDKYKKQKELLAKALQNYFSLDYDPFYPYRSSSEKRGNSYKIKITLIPHQNSDKKTAAAEENDDDLGVKEYLKEQAPQVNEE